MFSRIAVLPRNNEPVKERHILEVGLREALHFVRAKAALQRHIQPDGRNRKARSVHDRRRFRIAVHVVLETSPKEDAAHQHDSLDLFLKAGLASRSEEDTSES